MVTFPVTDMSKAEKPYWKPNNVPLQDAFGSLGKFEAFGGPKEVIEPNMASNGLWYAIHSAFMMHMPLILSPDHIWLQIARVTAEHITSNAELLRKHFVTFEGKQTLGVRNDNFVKGSPDNDWPAIFKEFSEQIRWRTGSGITDHISCDFTTTGPIEKAVSAIVLMDAMSEYFKYSMWTRSGIPEITLLGTLSDWSKVQDKAMALSKYGMNEWLDQLIPFLDEFIFAAAGNPCNEWWQSLYEYSSGSGMDYINGHIKTLFPKKLKVLSSIGVDSIPNSVSRVPFIWHYYDQEFKMRFCGGVPFATVNEHGAITPAAAWAIEEVP